MMQNPGVVRLQPDPSGPLQYDAGLVEAWLIEQGVSEVVAQVITRNPLVALKLTPLTPCP